MIESCRSCEGRHLLPVLSLGTTPLANALIPEDRLAAPESRFPLEIVFCRDCSLLQISDTVDPASLFREYLYFSSFSDALLKHAEQLTADVIARRNLDSGAHVVEIASNDGYLLQFYKRAGIRVTGIEPATNIALVARETRAIPTINEFFNEGLALKLAAENEQADVIHANNVLAHVPTLNDFVRGIKHLLKHDGVAIIEVPYVRDLIEKVEFDTIYHEHVFYFSLTALSPLFERHGLKIADVAVVPIHGGSLRLFVGHQHSEAASAVRSLLRAEAESSMDRHAYYRDFANRVGHVKTALTDIVDTIKKDGKNLAAYGASAKGSTLLNYCGIGPGQIDFVVDRSTHKQGLYMPGVRIPIRAPAALLEKRPDYVLLLTWNFADEILEQQSAYREAGGRFIVPIPEPRII
ncbi:MAG: class I SAM-dependent methyltransferase [Cyanobacteria bacterium]|nr:class I SAM-dependent methyltransferase [Cyanobacteriota bacterium]